MSPAISLRVFLNSSYVEKHARQAIQQLFASFRS